MFSDYPDFFPLGCPPDDALKAQGVFYRWTYELPPCAEDYESYSETGKASKFPFNSTRYCMCCGLSMYQNIEELRLSLIRPKRVGQVHIVKVALGIEHGMIKNTPTSSGESHHTWWIPQKARNLTELAKAHSALETKSWPNA
jgi:hypothetical protein